MLRFTIPHRYDFGAEARTVGSDLMRADAWDRLRLDTDGAFAIPSSRADMDALVDARPDIQRRAAAIIGIAGGGNSIASYGVGGAPLELAMTRLGAEVTATDYAPRTVDELGRLAPELHPRRLDLLADGPIEADVHLFHRVDTEFTNAQWRTILRRFSRTRVIVVGGTQVTWRTLVHEARMTLRGATKCGWCRTRAAQDALWSTAHDVEYRPVDDLDGWVLTPRVG